MSAVEAAWFAGYFDADGCVGIYNHKTKREDGTPRNENWVVLLGVSGIHRESLERWKAAFGGTLYLTNPRVRRPNERTLWQWKQAGRAALVTLAAITPYLVTKREQAEVALTYPLSTIARGIYQPDLHARRAELAATLKRLKAEVA